MPTRFLPSAAVPPEGATEVFEMQRPMLLRLAYRMLGSHGEAEDVVQEAWVRWHATDHAQLSEPAAWLSTVVSRLCLDIMKSARNRREIYTGPWLPEPLVEEESDDIRPDNLTLSLMLALERLSPLERAAFLLHDVFGQPLDQVAQTIDRSPAAARQLARRARAHVHVDRPRYTVPRETGERVARAFFDACKTGDSSALSAILSEGARLYSDGGGKVRNVLNIIYGKDNLVRMFKSLSRKRGGEMEYIHFTMIDGLPGFVWRLDGAIQTTAIEMDETQITAIYITRNPDKLSKIRLN